MKINFPIFTGGLAINAQIVIVLIKIFVIIFPANFVIKKLMPKYDGKKEVAEARNGMTIGNLERIIMLFLMYMNQVMAIGFVLTCKSITRFKQLENKNFAERYLIGTLLSTLITIIVYII